MEDITLQKNYEEPELEYDIISVSLFRMEDPYKNTSSYYNGLKNIIDNFDKVSTNIYLRIYYDNSIIKETHDSDIINKEIREYWKPLLDYARKKDKVQLVKYSAPKYQYHDGLYHKGLFGSLIRLIPLFDYHKDNSRIVIISDIDYNDVSLSKINYIYNWIIKSNSQFHFNTYAENCMFERFLKDDMLHSYHKPNTWMRILAGSIFCLKKIPYSVFDNFFKCLYECSDIKNIIQHICDCLVKKKKKYDFDKFPYGIDEALCNYFILPYLEKNNILMSVTILGNINEIFWLRHYNSGFLDKPNLILAKLYKKIMGKYYKESKTVKHNFELYDNITYKLKNSNNEKINKAKYFFDNTKEYLSFIKKNKNILKITDTDIKFIENAKFMSINICYYNPKVKKKSGVKI